MGFWGAITRIFAAGRTGQAYRVSDPLAAALFGEAGAETASGIRVSPETALSSTAVLACVRNIAEDIAKLPLHLYRKRADVRALALDHPLFRILYYETNPHQTSFEFREWLQASMLVYGYGICEIERDKFGRVLNLWPLHSRSVTAETIGGKLIYRVEWEGSNYVLAADQVMHLKGFSVQGLMGLSLPIVAREAVALDIAHQQYSARFFGNGAAPRGVLKHPKSLRDQDAVDRLKTQWNSLYTGLDNAHRVAVLEEGMEFSPIGINPRDSQLIEGKQFQIAEVCRVFRMQPHKVFELSRSTNNNIEQQAIENSQDTLQPHVSRWEQRIGKCLLLPSEKRAGELYAKFELASLLRGDSAAQREWLGRMVDKGIYSINEAREYLDMNPIEGGDAHLVQINTAPLGSQEATGTAAAGG